MLIKISWNWEKYILVPKRTTNNQENKKLTIYTPKKKKKKLYVRIMLNYAMKSWTYGNQ